MKKILSACLAISVFIITGCMHTKPSGSLVAKNIVEELPVVTIGVIAPLSGPGASYGQDVVEVVKRFGEQFNATNDTVQLNWIVENGSCNGKDAASAAQKLINVDQVVAIIGGVCSSETLGAGKIAQEAGVMMIAPGSASSKISTIGEYVVRTYNNTRAGTTLVAGLDNDYAKVVVITEEKDYPKDMADRFVDAYDGEVVYFSYQSADHDFKTLAKQIAATENAEALFMFSQSEATSIPLALALDDEGLLDQYRNHTYGANNLLVAPFLERLGALTEGMQEVNVATTAVDYTKDAYMKTLDGYAIQGDGFTVLQAADGFSMIADVVARDQEKTNRLGIKNYVYSFNEMNPYQGYLGTYWFDTVGDAVGIDFQMYAIQNGERVQQ